MFRLRFLSLALAAAVAAAVALPARVQAEDVTNGLADRLAPVLPAVVNIETVTTRNNRPYYFWGSGFVVEPSGVIVTNRHVIAGADRITVTGRDFPPQQAKPIYVSELLDLAMLRIDAGKQLPVLQFADSDAVRIGDPVFAIGNPLGIGLSVSAGIVSALNRNIRETIYDDFIQTDAAINHGNSGGPLIDAAGKVVGIDTALYSSPNNTGSIGLGFAMPANDAKFIVDQVIRFGEVRAGWGGLQLQHMTADLAAGLGVSQPAGVVVVEVDAHGPADAAGIMPGDAILRINGERATATQQVQRTIAESPAGQKLGITLLHQNIERSVTLIVASYPKPTAILPGHPMQPQALRIADATPSHPGMTLAPLTAQNRASNELDATQTGVLVTGVNPGGAAADQRIVAGDVILRVRQRAVTTPAQVRQELLDLSGHGVGKVALLVRSKKGTHWVVLPLAPDR